MNWVEELRRQFPVASRVTFLDIAYENCGALFVREALDKFLDDSSDVSPHVVKAGGAGRGAAIGVIEETRQMIAQLLGGVDAKNIAFTKNTNEGISHVLQGFDFAPGDNIVTDDQEHSSVLYPCINVRRRGVECRIAVSPDGVSVTPDMLWKEVDDRTRMIVVSHVQSATGYRLDLEALARRCRSQGVFLVVDAIQSLGFCNCDAMAWGVDAVATACYKGLLGIEGIGFLYCCDRLLDRIRPAYVAANSCIGLDRSDPAWRLTGLDSNDARKLENSSMSFTGIYALHAGLKRILQIGIDEIHKHISGLLTRLYEGLDELGFTIVTPADANHRCHSLSIKMSDGKAGYDYFQANGVFLSFSAGRYVRMSVAPFNTEEDIERALRVARDCPIR